MLIDKAQYFPQSDSPILRLSLHIACCVSSTTLYTMADADEDTIYAKSGEATQVETDLTDETQDFRLLNHLNL